MYTEKELTRARNLAYLVLKTANLPRRDGLWLYTDDKVNVMADPHSKQVRIVLYRPTHEDADQEWYSQDRHQRTGGVLVHHSLLSVDKKFLWLVHRPGDWIEYLESLCPNAIVYLDEAEQRQADEERKKWLPLDLSPYEGIE